VRDKFNLEKKLVVEGEMKDKFDDMKMSSACIFAQNPFVMQCISDNFETEDMFLNVHTNEQFQKQQSRDQNYINNIVQQFKYQKE
jgi:hypothetical protein